MSRRRGQNHSSLESSVIQLADACLLDHLSGEEVSSLDRLVCQNSEACEIYVEHLRQTYWLRMWAEGQAGNIAGLLSATDQAAILCEPVPSPRVGISDRPSSFANSISPHWGAGAYVGLLVIYFFTLSVLVSRPPRLRQQEVVNVADISSRPHVASIIRQMNCVWEDSCSVDSPQATELNDGDILNLVSGVAEIEFASGTKVLLQGPSHFVLNSPLNCQLRQGKLAARVPKQAIGFTVNTPTTQVVDLGTEFEVVTSESGETKVSVLSGQVSIGPAEAQFHFEPLVLEQGEARRIALRPGHNRPVVTEIFSTSDLLRDHLETAVVRSPIPDGLLAYWGFDESDSQVWDMRGNNHGNLAGVSRTPGLVGRGALRFGSVESQPLSQIRIPLNTVAISSAQALSVEATFVSYWSGEADDPDNILRIYPQPHPAISFVRLGFQHIKQPKYTGPALVWEVETEKGLYLLAMPLDGRASRPAFADLVNSSVHHVVATFDRDSQQMTIYWDGVKQVSCELADAQVPLVRQGVDEPRAPFHGVIDEVGIYRGALNFDEVLRHWNNVNHQRRYFDSKMGVPSQ